MPERPVIRERINAGGNYFARPSDLEFIPTGCKVLDLALGGGWAEGRVINIIGDKAVGKTLLCMEAACNFLIKHGASGSVKYREPEEAWDDSYALALGMPLDKVDFGDEPLVTVEDLIDDINDVVTAARGPTLYILDSLDALSDRAELSRDVNQGSYGADRAKKMSALFRQLGGPMARKNVTMIVVSQIRDKINVTFGRKTTRSGGRALDFFASQILFLAYIGQITRELKIKGTERKTQTKKGAKEATKGITRAVGIDVKAKVDKCKVGLPFREAEFPLMFGYGIDDEAACRAWLKKHNYTDPVPTEKLHAVVQKKWYEIENTFLPKKRKYGN